jgi:hypothetical protein
MILDEPNGELTVPADRFAARTGWEAKPEGLCKGALCVPAPEADRGDGTLDVRVLADRLRMPLVGDEERGVWALGPSTVGTGRALDTAEAADPTLADFDGNPFRLSSLRGRKVLLVAWASW